MHARSFWTARTAPAQWRGPRPSPGAPCPPPLALHEAVVAAQPMRTHGARTRQLLYIGKVMRQLESSVLSRVRAALEPGRAVASRP